MGRKCPLLLISGEFAGEPGLGLMLVGQEHLVDLVHGESHLPLLSAGLQNGVREGSGIRDGHVDNVVQGDQDFAVGVNAFYDPITTTQRGLPLTYGSHFHFLSPFHPIMNGMNGACQEAA